MESYPHQHQKQPGAATRSGRLQANRIDLAARQIRAGELVWQDGMIVDWRDQGEAQPDWPYLAPGFIDAHVHIESSLLPPAEFARLAVRHGTVAVMADPHEIANVLGQEGVGWMLDNAARSPFHFLFGAPSCVPATPFESAGASLDAEAVAALLEMPGIGFLSEVMNYPAVLASDPEMLAKLAAARKRGLPVDGHAPGLTGEPARRYIAAGISTDHECVTLAEAEEKIAYGMRILLREGSAARNFEALHPLLGRHAGKIMFCTDDCHPDTLARGHIDRLIARALAYGYDLFDVLEAACLTPQEHYGLDLGRLRVGDAMNAVLLENLRDVSVRATWLDGRLAAENGRTLLPRTTAPRINAFAASPVSAQDLCLKCSGAGDSVRCRVIEARDGQLVTGASQHMLPCRDGQVMLPPGQDILWLAVLNRYRPAQPALALIRGFGLRQGAIASSVAHDSHNIVAVGCDAHSLADAINLLVRQQGGLSLVGAGCREILPLPIAGLMSNADADAVAAQYSTLDAKARHHLGSCLQAPFMTLSFMALLVIPELKLGDGGLFDSQRFEFVPVCGGEGG